MAANSPARIRPELTVPQVWWLLATGVVTALPLVPNMPAWLSALVGLALFWRAWLARQGLALPPRWLLTLLVLASSGAVFIQFRTLFGQNPGVALLILFLALKQLEARNPRDGLTIVLLAYFLGLAQFFYGQSIVTALASAAATLSATATLISLTDARPRPMGQLRRAGLLLLQAVPFMLICFVLFPRVQGPLWGLPKDAHSAQTGLDDAMAPGSISQLSQSDAIAFRVRFPGPLPERQQLYWRGPVLSEFDGRTWRPHLLSPRSRLPYEEPATAGIDYEVTLEAHGRRWLFALELPGKAPQDTVATRDFQLLARAPVTERHRYGLRSYPQLTAGQDDSPLLLQRERDLPSSSNPRLRALAERWRATASSDEEVLRQAQAFFLGQRLIYTLSPPLLGEHTADEFLFDTRQGFCEHFANAFAIAMRSAGVPARVVTGYQGGERNPIDGYLTVRQSDAHAWTEVWLPDRGWLRVDPTAISAPRRIDGDLAAAVPRGDPLPFLVRVDLAWLQELRFRWEAIGNAWNQWVLGYNPERQQQLLRRLGMATPDWQSMTLLLTGLSGAAMAVLAVWILGRHRRQDPVLKLWTRLDRRLAKRGLGRHAHEGPIDYAERISRTLPVAAKEIRIMAGLYSRLRYGRDRGDQTRLFDEFRRRVASFRP
jgi:transglutaminase-like putative cysteine protease